MRHPHVLVTGGAGFIGSHLVERLVRDDLGSVTALDNLQHGNITNLAECQDRIRFIRADIRDEGALRTAMLDMDAVFHLAAQSNVLGAERDPDYVVSTNVLGTINVLRSALEAGVRRVVFSSSREVYGDPDVLPVPETAPVRPKNRYGASKASGEAYCHAFQQAGLEVVILRLANVFGPRDSDRVIPIFLRNSQRGDPLMVYGGSQVVDFVWVADVVDSLVRAATVPQVTEPINVGSGFGISVLDLARTILDITGSDSDLQICPARRVETCRFVADTRRLQAYLGVATGDGFVRHLTDLLPCDEKLNSPWPSKMGSQELG